MSEQQLRVLLVDDEWSLREPLAKHLQDTHDYHVDTAADAKEALRLVAEAEQPYDVALIDDLLVPRLKAEPEPIGIELMSRIRECYPKTACIIFTGWGMERALEALRAGAYRYLAKPLNLDELGMTIRMTAEQAQLRRERDLLSATLEISKAMLSGMDIEGILKVIADAVPELIGAEACTVARVDPATGQVQHEPMILIGDVTVLWHRHLKEVSLTWQIIETSEAFVLSDVDARTDEVDENLRRAGVKSFIGVPIPGEPQNLGVLYAYSTRREAFGTHEQRVLQLLAGQSAIALENARLFKQAAVERDTVELLYKISRKLSASGLDMDSVLQEILTLATNSIKADEGSLFIVDKDGRVHRWRTVGLPPVKREPVEEILKRGFAGWVLKNRRADIVSDILADERWLSFPDDLLQRGSAIGVPVVYGGKTLGALTLTCSEPAFFKEEHLDLLASIADQAAIAIENAMIFEHIQRHSRLMDALVEVSRKLAGTVDLQEQMKAVWLFVRDQLSAPMFFVALYDDLRDTLHFEAIYEMGQPVSMLDRVLTNREVWGLTGFVVKTGGTIEWYTFEQKQKALEKLSIQPHQVGVPCITCLVLPLMIGKQVIGAISIQSDRPHAWDEVCLDAFRALTSHVATSLKNAQFYQEAQAGLQTLQSLYEGGSAIISTMDPERILDVIVQKAHCALEAWRAEVIRITEMEEPTELTALGFDKRPDIVTWIRPDGISVQVLRSGEPRVIENVEAESDTVNPWMLQDGVGSAICMPLSLRDKNIGVMWIHYREPRTFSQAEIEALRIYANQAAIAYDNARRMRELEHLRRAAEKLASVAEVQPVLQQIVKSAKEVLGADSAVVWSYDNVRRIFFPDELVAEGIEPEQLEQFRYMEPQLGGTAEHVMRQGYLAVTDVEDPKYAFLGPSERGLRGALRVKAFQGVALRVNKETLGVLYVNYREPRGFTAEDRNATEAFAYHTALALKKARLLEQVSRARDTAKVVAEVSVLENLRSTLNSIAQGTQDVLHCDAVTLYTYDQVKDEFEFPPAMVGVRDTGEVLKFGLVVRKSVIRRILALDKAHVAEDTPSDPLMGGAFVRREEIKSSVGIPLKVGDRKVGVMFVNYRSRHRFTADELTSIELFANQAAVAIRNAQLYDELQKRAAALQALYEAGRAITGTLSLDEILRRIVEQAWRLAEPREEKTHFSHLALVDGNRIRFVAAHPPEALTKLQDGVHEIDLERDVPIGITGRIVVTRQSRLVENVLEDPDYIETDPRIRSQLGVPIQMGERFIGVINVEHPDYNAFSEEDRQTLESLAAHAAIAIENARHFEDLKKIKGYIGSKTAVDWIRMVSTAWGHAIRREVGTALGRVALMRGLLARGESAQEVEEELDQLENVIRDIKEIPITAPLSYEDAVDSVQINGLVKTYLERRWAHVRYKPVRLCLDLQKDLDSIVTIRASREWLRRALEIPVDNSVQGMLEADSPEKRLTVTTRLVGEMIEISVTDTGPGISKDVLEKLFKEPIDKPIGSRGAGIGLMLAQTIVQTYGGAIRVEPPGERGADMVIVLPIEN